MINVEYVEILEERLAWAVNAERYELASGLRDQIRLHSTKEGEDEDWKNQYYAKLFKKYSPEFYESIKHKYEK
jgi:hypothetical protein